MVKSLKLKFSIMLGNVIPLILIVIVALAVHLNVQVVKQACLDAQLAHEVTSDMADLYIAIIRMERAARVYLLFKNETSSEFHKKALEHYKELLPRLPQKIKDSKQREAFRNITEAFGKTIEMNEQIFASVNAGKPEEAMELFRSGLTFSNIRETDGLRDDFKKRESEITFDRTNKQNDAIIVLSQALFGGVLLAIIIALALGQWLASSISESVSTAINNASSTSAEIAATIAQHERTANHQATMVTETTTTMEELGASSRQSAEQAAAGTEMTKRAASLTEEGRVSVKQTMEAMSDLKNKIEDIAQQTLNLGEQTGQVGSIAELVKDFAGQINMLSLNAAVEAARAGEHGKGFAVVAFEVRKLAVESKKAAEQAKVFLSGIQKATDATLMKTEEGIKGIETVTTAAGKVNDTFGNLSEIADQIYTTAQQILLNAKQQSMAVAQVTEAANSINAGAKETAAGLSQTKIGVQNLNEMTNKLKEMI